MAFEDELVGSAKPMTAPTAWREVVEAAQAVLDNADTFLSTDADEIGGQRRDALNDALDALEKALRALARPAGGEGGDMADDARESMARSLALRAWVLRRLAVIARDFPETAQSIDDIAGALAPTPAAQPPARAEGQPEGEAL